MVGGFFSPSIETVNALRPELVFVSPFHEPWRERFDPDIRLVELSPRSLDDVYRHLALLGRVFDKEEQAGEAIEAIKGELLWWRPSWRTSRRNNGGGSCGSWAGTK